VDVEDFTGAEGAVLDDGAGGKTLRGRDRESLVTARSASVALSVGPA